MKRKTTSRNGAKAPRKVEDSSLAEEVRALEERVARVEGERGGMGGLIRYVEEIVRELRHAREGNWDAPVDSPMPALWEMDWYGPYKVEYLAGKFAETQHLDPDDKPDSEDPNRQIRDILVSMQGFRRPDIPPGKKKAPKGIMVQGWILKLYNIPIPLIPLSTGKGPEQDPK